MIQGLLDKVWNSAARTSEVITLRNDRDSRFTRNRITAIRLICSIVVVVSHLDMAAGNSTDNFRKLGLFAVAIFFGLSGFLLTENLLRNGAHRNFLKNRILRIFPGFIIALIITSFFFVPIYERFVNYKSGYFITMENFTYVFMNITTNINLVDINRSLDTANIENWNVPLWTLRYELMCYLFLFAIFKILPKKNTVLIASLFLVSTLMFLFSLSTSWNVMIQDFLYKYQYVFLLGYYSSFFAFGSLIFLINLRMKITVLVISVLVLIFSLLSPWAAQESFLQFRDYLLEISLVPIIVALAFWQPVNIVLKNDYSYGVYIYGFPVTQLVVGISKQVASNFVCLTIVVMFFTSIFSWLSWKLIEKPMMKFKN